MTTYAITSGESGMFYVVQTFEHGHTTHQDVTHGPYKNDESAKRRIRDLKRKEINAGVHGNLESKPFTVTPINGFEIHETFILRQVGCYPAISKHAYRR